MQVIQRLAEREARMAKQEEDARKEVEKGRESERRVREVQGVMMAMQAGNWQELSHAKVASLASAGGGSEGASADSSPSKGLASAMAGIWVWS